ncbi:glycosyltransferase 87 family protein [Desulfatiferula olefinivorans]
MNHNMSPFQRCALVISTAGMVASLWFVYTRLHFFYGVDYHMFCTWLSGYMKSGVFFPEDTVFFNFPLTVIAFGPWGFLPVDIAVALKGVQTVLILGVSLVLVDRIRPGLLRESPTARFAVILIALTFGLTQLFYLNIYAEVACCLLLSVFFLERKREGTAALFFSLALVFKVFLLPLFLAPLICGKYGFALRIGLWMMFLCVVSLMLFGWDTHVEMIRAMGETYGRMRIHGIGFAVVADGFAGWQDLFNKLVREGLIHGAMVVPLTVTAAGLYGCLALFTVIRMVSAGAIGLRDNDFYVHVFGSLLILCLGFNFRFDHGLLMLGSVYLFAAMGRKRGGLVSVTLFLTTFSGFVLTSALFLAGWVRIADMVKTVLGVLSFQFIGLNALVFLVAAHWSDGERMGQRI